MKKTLLTALIVISPFAYFAQNAMKVDAADPLGANPRHLSVNSVSLVTAVSKANSNKVNAAMRTSGNSIATACTKVNLPAPGTWNPVNYYTGGPPVGANGWVNGVNIYADKQKAMYFDESAQTYTIMNNIWISFGLAYSSNPAKIVPVHVYDGTTGVPTTLLATGNLTMGQIMSDVAGNYYTEISFVNNPITLPASKKFFVSVDLVNLNWATSFDTLSIVSNTGGETSAPIPVWEQQSDNLWYNYTNAASWGLSISLYIHPFLTNANSVATFTQSATTICQGSSILFDATGSTYEDTLLWYFPSATPLTSNSVTQSTTYPTAGTYPAILYIIGGGCDLFDSAFVNITVNPNPVLTVSATPSTVCLPGTSTLTASGANTYIWSPATGLSSTTTATTVSTPTATITYNVQGTTTATGCFSNALVPITVLSAPVALENESSTSICVGGTVVFNGSPSTGGGLTYSWVCPGGSPSSSSSANPTITYNVAGNYTATLTVTNACGTSSVTSQTIGVGCTGIDPVVVTEPSLFYNTTLQELNISLPNSNGNYHITIFDQLGNEVKMVETNKPSLQLGVSELSAGVYFVQITNDRGRTISRFIK